jgi:CIC family chloride channel protein
MFTQRPTLPAHRQNEARAIGRRTHQVLLLSAATGVAVGLAVVVLQKVTVDGLLEPLSDRPLWMQAAAPAVGLLVAWACLRWLAERAGPTTTDAYIRNFHEEAHERLSLKPVFGRVLASIATIGYGGALGLEGPAIYTGAAAGSSLQRRFARFFSREDAKLLMVAGAAAGIAAIFKAPATGALFAIEVPYRADLARRNVLPAMVAAAASYAAFAAVDGTTPILPLEGGHFDLPDLAGATVVGVLCGGGARLFSMGLRFLRSHVVDQIPLALRVVGAGATLALLAVITEAAADVPLNLGPGYDVIGWATDPGLAQWLVLLVLAARVAAILATVGGGGVGGLVIPLVVLGALVGRLAGGAFGAADDSALLIVVGMAAFFGAGYRTPLAAVMFVAEATGSPGFVVPALLATAAAQLVIGDESVSRHQRAGRLGHLERRFELPISAVLETDVRTVPPDATIEEFLTVHLVGYRQRAVAVVENGNRYLGLAVLDEVVAIRREAWATTEIRTIARVTVPRGRTTWLVRDAVHAMEGADTDVLPVVDGEDRFVGVVTTEGVLRLDEILERTGGG